MTTRREFLAGSAAAILLGGRLLRAEDAKATGIPIGIQMYSLRGYDTDTALKHAHELGFRRLEFYPGQFPIESTPEQIAAKVKQVQELGCSISGHGVNRFTKDHEKNEKIFAFSKAAGIRNLSADPDPDSFDSLDKLVAEHDIRIAIHNHGPTHRYNKAVDVATAVRDHHQNIGACADLGHYIRSGEDPVQVIRLLGDRLYGVHLKDFADKQDKTKGVILGQGHLDLVGVFQALKEVKFPADGALSLEYEENKDDPLADIRACLEAAQTAEKKVWA